jgi:hypothetical protein
MGQVMTGLEKALLWVTFGIVWSLVLVIATQQLT